MKAVQEFARDTLMKSDDMAVLCVLSRGLWNHVYGYDGKLVAMRDLIDCFSDESCEQMKGKPKFVLMQTSQIGRLLWNNKLKCSIMGYSRVFYKPTIYLVSKLHSIRLLL